MQYYVPQFIEMESKVIGNFTLKQFLIITSPLALIAILFFIFKSKVVVIFFGIIFVGGGVMLAFYKFQGQDIMSVISYGFNYFFNPREYIWFKEGEQKMTLREIKTVIEQKEKVIPTIRKEESKLKKMSWLIQTGR